MTLPRSRLQHAALLLLVSCTTVFAVDCTKNPDRWLDDQCRGNAVRDTAAQVEHAFADLTVKADDARKSLLVDAHRAWLAYRDRQCQLEFDTTRTMHSAYARNGATAPLLEQRCQIRLNEIRLLELRAMVRR